MNAVEKGADDVGVKEWFTVAADQNRDLPQWIDCEDGVIAPRRAGLLVHDVKLACEARLVRENKRLASEW